MVHYAFDTASDFPMRALEHLSHQYPEAKLIALAHYSDDSWTIATWEGGELIGVTEF
jgi:hypothetical protein